MFEVSAEICGMVTVMTIFAPKIQIFSFVLGWNFGRIREEGMREVERSWLINLILIQFLFFSNSPLPSTSSGKKNFNSSSRRGTLVSDWLKFTRAWVET